MSIVYSMSDIHGCIEPLARNMKVVDLSKDENKLIFCGDYIDYGTDSARALYIVYELVNKYPQQVIALMGNHESMILDFLSLPGNDIEAIEWLRADRDFRTVNTFISTDTLDRVNTIINTSSYSNFYTLFGKIIPLIQNDITRRHGELINWLKKLPFYYETDDQIFVHAGIDEEAGEYWKVGTTNECFVSKYPATFGKFHKDIVAGHISTNTLTDRKDFHDVFWDGKSHFFIDGQTNVSGIIPLLIYDTASRSYTTGQGKRIK